MCRDGTIAWDSSPGPGAEGEGTDGSGEGLEPPLRGRAARAPRRAAGILDLRAPDRADAEGPLAIPHQRPGHLLCPRGSDPAVPARPEGGDRKSTRLNSSH